MFNARMFNGRRQRHREVTISAAITLACMIAGSMAHASPTAAASFHTETDIAGNTVRLGDIADLSTLPAIWQQQSADLVVARLRETDSRVVIESGRLAEAARRQMPAIGPWLSVQDAQAVVVVRHSSSSAIEKTGRQRATQMSSCLQLNRDVSPGDAILRNSVNAVSCPQEVVVHAARYDEKSHVTRATLNLASGSVITGIAAQRLAQISRGDRVKTIVQSGAITVTRTGTALTDSAPGRVAMITTGTREIVAVPATALMAR